MARDYRPAGTLGQEPAPVRAALTRAMRREHPWQTARRVAPRYKRTALPSLAALARCRDGAPKERNETFRLGVQGPSMFITIFSCISAALCVYCVLSRVNKRAIELAVRLAVRDIEKEFEIERAQLLAQLESARRRKTS
jgi:hypothetical protein